MTQHLPLNGDGVTDKVSRHLYAGTGNGAGYVIAKQSPALALKRAIHEAYGSSDNSAGTDSENTEAARGATALEAASSQRAVDPSQGHGASNPSKPRDPLLKSLERVLSRGR